MFGGGTIAAGARRSASPARPGYGRRLPWDCLVEDISGGGWAKASPSGMAATGGSDLAGGLRAGMEKDGQDGMVSEAMHEVLERVEQGGLPYVAGVPGDLS